MTRRPFGKYGGVELAGVPRQYLRWLRRRPWLGAWRARAIDDELNGRAASDGESFEEAPEKWKQEDLARQGGGSMQVDTSGNQ
jgi:hypothetical protein